MTVLDKYKYKLNAAISRRDQPIIAQFEREIEQLTKKLNQLKHKQSYDLNKERKMLLDMPFQRELTKEEQADLGALKKKVKGLVVIHPLTKLGKSLKLSAMTGFRTQRILTVISVPCFSIRKVSHLGAFLIFCYMFVGECLLLLCFFIYMKNN